MRGSGPQTSYAQATLANALRVFQAGSGRGTSGLKAAGALIGSQWAKAIQASLSVPGGSMGAAIIGQSRQTPSAPGTPPHRQSGALRDSIKWRTARLAGQKMGTGAFMRSGRVVIDIYQDPNAPDYDGDKAGSHVYYGALHEFGGVMNGRTYPERPFFRPQLRSPAMRAMVRTHTRNFFIAEEVAAAARMRHLKMHMVPIIMGSTRSLRPMKFN